MDELNRKTVEAFKQAEKIPVLVVLDNIRSAHNVGSVFRTADAFLLHGIHLCGYTAYPPNRHIEKTALGATESVDWKHFSTVQESIRLLKEEGFTICAAEQADKSMPLYEAAALYDKKLAVVFGNEVDGIQPDVLQLCDVCLEIPQAGIKHSLNISVAAGMVLWELVRTRIHLYQ
ncbi:MAG: RNA methyltransferase [Williamsia sp.]|nr:RNA methyltransferase [Williamsia sp.]